MPVTPASASLHGALLEKNSPDWLIDASAERRQALKDHAVPTPDWYKQATREQRAAVGTAVAASLAAQNRLDKVMAGLQTIDAFAEPLLVKALKDQYKVELDLNTTVISLKQPLEWGIQGTDVGAYEVLRLPLLQAALHNFEASEAEDNAFHASSGFLTQTAGTFTALDTPFTVTQFTRLCRELDIGVKYQSYLKDFFKPDEGQALRLPFIDAQKTALRTAAELALLKKDILPADYSMILQVIDGATDPGMGDQQVWFRDLFMMKRRMTGCVLFIICEKYRYPESLILYIPNDPLHPLKRYTFEGMRAMFKQRFTTRDTAQPRDGSPTPEQRQFSRFVAYADLPHYFQTFTKDAADLPLVQKISPYLAIANKVLQGINPFAGFQHLPEVPVDQQPNDDPFLAPAGIPRRGEGLWSENIELWGYLFEQYRDKLIADARSHAVPTADVDARVRSEKLANLLNIGMLALTTVAMFVPVLGEVTMVAMVGQLMSQTFEASIEWSEGDIQAAKAHLIDVAENLAFIALTAAAGKTLGKLTAAKATPVIEQLDAVTLANGERRLWKPDLRGYERPVAVDRDVPATDLGQFEFDGKTHVRLHDQFYQKAYDPALKRWRVEHAADTGAYRPPLSHNGRGAWRHVHERPLKWDRLTLLRRMGPVTDRFTDEQLLQIADISGASDNTLRRMHLDNAAPPPELADALRLFEANQDVAQVIEQIETGRAIDDRYLFILPLVAELPRWPAGRVLQVFEGAELSGPSLKYGSERRLISAKRKAPIRISRADVLSGALPARILAELDETEIVRLLGGEPARVKEARPLEFRKQIADFARTRQPALFESLYSGATPPDPQAAKLQRLCPGLSESAAHRVLIQATAEELTRLNTGHAPLRLLEQGRWYAQQGRVARSLAGLHTPNLLSADSKRLALHTLARLPGWSGKVRLEIRDGHIEGPLVDAIGDPACATRKYLVKKGPMYQAFNDRGETLNGLPRDGDNFYPSILHALPDEARQALGIPGVGQSADLQRAIVEQAIAQPLETARLVREPSARKPWFKPPQRIAQNLLGYPASGDGQWADADLIERVQLVYPQLADADAQKLLLDQWRQGKNRRQIMQWLEMRLEEWDILEATLDEWVGADTSTRTLLGGKREVAQALKFAWRNAPLIWASPTATSRLDLFLDAPLPALTADFSHVRELGLGGPGLNDVNLDSFLRAFGQIEQLTITVSSSLVHSIPTALGSLSRLTHLRIFSNFSFSEKQITALENMTQLEHLQMRGLLGAPANFDVSRLTRLRSLTIAQFDMIEMPEGVLRLPDLERLDLRETQIRQLPEELLDGHHDRQLAGLSMEWFWFSREAFKPVYEYVNNHPAHLIDIEEMVKGYCRGRLGHLSGSPAGAFRPSTQTPFVLLFDAFMRRWQGAEARFAAIEAVLDQYSELDHRLKAWRTGMNAQGSLNLTLTLPRLRLSWYEGLLHRYGVRAYMPALTLTGITAAELPQFAREDFAHVTTLSLREMRAPIEQVPGFLGNFSQLQNLDMSGSQFADIELSRVGLDVSGLSQLKALNLSGTNLEFWPAGTENLTWLDLSNTAISTLPDDVLASDERLLRTHLKGTPLPPQVHEALTATRARIEQARGLPPGTLERLAGDPLPRAFPPPETVASIFLSLLPLPVDAPATEGLAQRLQRVSPLPDDEALRAIAQMRADGLSEARVAERIGSWHRDLVSLTRQLNGWLCIRETEGAGWQVASHTRRLAALRIVQCWRESLIGWSGIADRTLSLDGLQVGNLPELPVRFPHVESLDLTAVRLSGQDSNGFLRTFTGLRSLTLSGQALPELPRALSSMAMLERLALSGIELLDPQEVYSVLGPLEHLHWLDLSHNDMPSFSVASLPRLEVLDLRNNLITHWPEGTLHSTHLRELNLSGNRIADIPVEAFNGQHDGLMQGTDLSDNSLSGDSLMRLWEYAQSVQPNAWLGYTPDDVDLLLDESGSGSEEEVTVESDVDEGPMPVLPDEVITQLEARPEDLQPWLEVLDPAVAASHRTLWNQLAAEPDNGAFFHLLGLLRLTPEYRLARADLTRRVWDVSSAAAENSELRQALFGMASTHGTCEDGRILTFSALEVKVFENKVLQGIAPDRLEEKGAALLRLSRQLFRLGKVEELADKAIGAHGDPAEVRLEYRLGLARGWPDGLELPGQPKHMMYGRPISGAVLQQARATIEAMERSDAFYEDLISRDYWVQYLEEKYPEAFSTLNRDAARRQGQVEDAHQGLGDAGYAGAVEMLGIELSIARNEKLIELSRRETAATSAT
ncbi:NEL-type E3 ubiquitin ligase domain-containing protein [Pseudomonas sp. MYb118]|uniref:NEL-type E3 ubiquitin ligase domain-containing protein n=1 Tax=Pseudomonas sp. MYb118 TaxID=1848720 RepID=UPI0034CF915F